MLGIRSKVKLAVCLGECNRPLEWQYVEPTDTATVFASTGMCKSTTYAVSQLLPVPHLPQSQSSIAALALETAARWFGEGFVARPLGRPWF
jgi:hypothetical protein